MKSIALMSIGLLGSAVTAAGVTGYLAWNSLSGSEMKSDSPIVTAVAQTQPAPVRPVAAPTQPAAFTLPASASTLSQTENDFLYDLTQALQPVEHERLSDAERLDIAEQLVKWLNAGADYWSIRADFDAVYQNQIAGDYAFNREVYIKFTAERFAPDRKMALLVPPRSSRNDSAPIESPNFAPEFPAYEEPYYEEPYEESYEPPYEEPPYGIPAPHPVPPPHAHPYPYPHPPIARPPYPQPRPDWPAEDGYPVPQPPYPQPPIAQQPPISPQRPPAPEQPPTSPDWYQNPSPSEPPYAAPSPQPPQPDQNPNVTEISASTNPTL